MQEKESPPFRRAVKVLEKTILVQRFNTLCEYILQMPSLSDDTSYAAPVRREVVHSHDASVLLLYAQKEDSFLMIQEYRTGVFFNESGDDPLILQCVAGMIEGGITPEETAQKEAWEEAGVRIPLNALQKIGGVYASPGRITEKVHLFFCALEEAPVCGVFGLPEEGEQIRTKLVPRDAVYHMMDEHSIKDSMALLALNWFRAHEATVRG